MSDRWNISGYDRDMAVRLVRSGINPLVAVILASRGIEDKNEIAGLTKNDISIVSDPLLLKDMDKAAARVRRAIEDKERVTVYGDYDVDGITSSCIVADYLRRKGLSCDIYIPERLEEGYGVKSAALDTIKSRGTSLVVTVDCGITAVSETEYAKTVGLDMVIIDHHECGTDLPEAVAVVDPKRADCPSPAKSLAGVGVAFKLICAVEGAENTEKLLYEYSDLVAAGTIADAMPVTGENRVFIKHGLERIRQGSRPGLSGLCAASGIDESRASVTNIGFVLAPRINAAGRIGTTDTAVRLLLTRDRAEAGLLAVELCALNRERQRIEGEMFQEAVAMLKDSPCAGRPAVLASESWHQGVAGIVASRVSEKYGVPAVMICLKDGVGRGSCRSVDGFNIYEALSSVKDVLIGYGGHDMAAGLTIEEAQVGALRERLGEKFNFEAQERSERRLNVDFEVIKPELMTIQNIAAMEVLEPYGHGNPQPVLCMKDMVIENVMPLSEGKHTKMWLSKCGEVFEAVFFSKSIKDLNARVGAAADAAFHPQINEFRGRRTVQLYLVDLAVH